MSTERKPEFFAGKDAHVGIIGCGYVGLPLALRFADVGHKVTGFDLDKAKVDKLNAGQSYIQHISAEKIREHVQAKRFDATADFSRLKASGRRADLRADSARRAPRARSHLRRRYGEGDRPEPAAQSAHRPRKHHVSRHHRRAGSSDPRKDRPEMPDRARRGRRRRRHRFLSRLFARARRPRQQAVRPGADSQSRRRDQSSQRPRRDGTLRANRLESRAGQLDARRRNGQAARKYFPLRQHRAGERTQAALPPHGSRRLGSDRQRRDQALRLHAVLSRARGSAAIAFPSIRTIFRGRRANTISPHASSNWPARSIRRCRTTWSTP